MVRTLLTLVYILFQRMGEVPLTDGHQVPVQFLLKDLLPFLKNNKLKSENIGIDLYSFFLKTDHNIQLYLIPQRFLS